MEYHELESTVADLNGELATIRLRGDPSREFLVEIEYCAERDGVEYVYLFMIDRRTLAYIEGPARVKVADIIDLRTSGIAVEGAIGRPRSATPRYSLNPLNAERPSLRRRGSCEAALACHLRPGEKGRGAA
jgi:hypothetical protein